MSSASHILLFGYGNPSRGDDALAPLLVEKLDASGLKQGCGHPLRYLTDYQIQIEHVTDLKDCFRAILIDADSSLDRPYRFFPLIPRLETTYTTHGMSPQTLLHTFERIYDQPPPPVYMLAIQGSSFDLGQELSPMAQSSLHKAMEFTRDLMSRQGVAHWRNIAP